MKQREEFDHKKMMTTPNDWTLWPILPVKRSVKESSQGLPGIEVGVLYAHGKPIVYLGNMFEIKSLKDCPKKEYKDFDELLADGWVVD